MWHKGSTPAEFGATPTFSSFDEALAKTKPDIVSINTFPDTHAEAIDEDLDLSAHMGDAVRSLRIVLAADQSVQTGKLVTL